MNAQSDPQAGPRRLVRSILAILAGIVTGIVLSMGTDLSLHIVGLAPALSVRWPNKLLLLATTYRSVYAVFASYVIAGLAPSRPMAHSLLAGVLGLVVSTLGAVAAWSTTAGQHWYPVTLALTAMPTAWAGAKLWLMQVQVRTATG